MSLGLLRFVFVVAVKRYRYDVVVSLNPWGSFVKIVAITIGNSGVLRYWFVVAQIVLVDYFLLAKVGELFSI